MNNQQWNALETCALNKDELYKVSAGGILPWVAFLNTVWSDIKSGLVDGYSAHREKLESEG